MALTPTEKAQDVLSEIKHGVHLKNRLGREPILRGLIYMESKKNKIPVEEVEKRKFQETITALQVEAASDTLKFGIIERSSPAFQELLAAIHVFFTPEQIKKFREDARPRFGIFRPLAGLKTPTKKESKDSEDFFQNKFKPYNPDPKKAHEHVPKKALLDEHALASRNMRLILKRLLSETDLTPFAARGGLRSILRRHPEVGADIGMLLLTKELLDSIEHAQEIKSNWMRVYEGIKRSIQEDFSTLSSKDLEGSVTLIKNALKLPKKNVLFGSIAVVGSAFLAPIIPLLRTFFLLPRALSVGARDAFVLTGQGNKRPRP